VELSLAPYDHLNRELFKAALPDVFITYQRRANSAGYFSPDRFSARVSELGRHELALNPDGFIGQSDEWIVSVLGHEMAHVWQQHFGKPQALMRSREASPGCPLGTLGGRADRAESPAE
jgi:hypothetical protein